MFEISKPEPGQPVPEKWDTLVHIDAKSYIRIEGTQSETTKKWILDLLQRIKKEHSEARVQVAGWRQVSSRELGG